MQKLKYVVITKNDFSEEALTDKFMETINQKKVLQKRIIPILQKIRACDFHTNVWKK